MTYLNTYILDFMSKSGLNTLQGSHLFNPVFVWEFPIALEA